MRSSSPSCPPRWFGSIRSGGPTRLARRWERHWRCRVARRVALKARGEMADGGLTLPAPASAAPPVARPRHPSGCQWMCPCCLSCLASSSRDRSACAGPSGTIAANSSGHRPAVRKTSASPSSLCTAAAGGDGGGDFGGVGDGWQRRSSPHPHAGHGGAAAAPLPAAGRHPRVRCVAHMFGRRRRWRRPQRCSR